MRSVALGTDLVSCRQDRMHGVDTVRVDQAGGGGIRQAGRRYERDGREDEGPRTRESRASLNELDTAQGTRVLCPGGTRTPIHAMIAFIDDHRETHGVERIYKGLHIPPSTYHDHISKRADPTKLSVRAKRTQAVRPEITRVFKENFEVYGERKVWRRLGAKPRPSRGVRSSV